MGLYCLAKSVVADEVSLSVRVSAHIIEVALANNARVAMEYFIS